ncbi:hypothetical protein COT87_01315 [Candidatus Collierbacteria bacterium CG10_big_fil_rev_8_21_14_0_10_44_9]|uniref:Uncharacterized protein n=1 Tax=Candidatus Collierbacteria bacterium CG10_big_fil_rev_8_21_14_0_10_44_9 TaxID=1974535 RepID=A0A2H0VL87_9BACT|nr:MAG: hypothetical protein COT87_01315 [Candidatus Collierbacteria bacterium CG10_big_fil_rev_8_21_14_0_10_44_9]
MAKSKPTNSTQKYLPIKEVRDGILVLKTGGFRTVLMVNAINFNLKSRDEQEAMMQQYQSFLNGLGFPIQIVVQSRMLNLDDYLTQLDVLSRKQTNDLLHTQTVEYTNFVRELIGVANIMSKTFYLVVPYDTGVELPTGGLFAGLFGKKGRPLSLGGKFAEVKTKLMERTSLASSGLAGLGLHNVQLNTQELVELFYTTYNIDTARRQKLFSVSNVDASVIQHLKDSTPGQ